MTNSKIIFHDLVNRIISGQGEGEARSVAFLVMEHVFGLSRTDIAAEKMINDSSGQQAIREIIDRLNGNEPIQYVLGEAVFFGRKFKVDSSVLIPRPETEELVQWIVAGFPGNKKPLRILDVGTGSGCIAITISLEMPGAKIFATDVSEGALQVARLNATLLKAEVEFLRHDILHEQIPFYDIDVVVSNPPYISLAEKSLMSKNVNDFEPHLALFVPDANALVFYKAILDQQQKILNPEGIVAVEINERFGQEVAGLFDRNGLTEIHILKDLSGKDRMVVGKKVNRTILGF